MNRAELRQLVSRSKDSRLQSKALVCNVDALAAGMAAFTNGERGPIMMGVVDQGGLGSGIKRALEAWPEIDFMDDRERCLFTPTVHRTVGESSEKPEKTTGRSGKMSVKEEESPSFSPNLLGDGSEKSSLPIRLSLNASFSSSFRSARTVNLSVS